jgi:ribosomal protein S18
MPSKKTATPSRRRTGPASAPGKRKSCHLCRDKVDEIDYKNTGQLRRYISEKGKIRSLSRAPSASPVWSPRPSSVREMALFLRRTLTRISHPFQDVKEARPAW